MGLFVIDLALAVDLFPEADPFLEATVGARPANHIFTRISKRALIEKVRFLRNWASYACILLYATRCALNEYVHLSFRAPIQHLLYYGMDSLASGTYANNAYSQYWGTRPS